LHRFGTRPGEREDMFAATRFNALAQTMFGSQSAGAVKQTQTFARPFMAPGMWHCQAGPGPNAFGGMIQQPVPFDPQHDLLNALTHWVENGVAPTSVIAAKYVNDTPQAGIQMQRPLCVYPQIPEYKGTGDPSLAANFRCITDERTDFNETPAPQYGREVLFLGRRQRTTMIAPKTRSTAPTSVNKSNGRVAPVSPIWSRRMPVTNWAATARTVVAAAP